MVKYSILNIQVEKTTYFKEINVCKCPCKLLQIKYNSKLLLFLFILLLFDDKIIMVSKMNIALFSDIHGNYQALKAIIDDIKKNNIDEVIFLGDSIALGPSSDKCLKLLKESNIKFVLGNHELYTIKGTSIDRDMSYLEIQHHNWVDTTLDKDSIDYLKECKYDYEIIFKNKVYYFLHFFFHNSNYPFYHLSILKNKDYIDIFNNIDADYIFFGHEHHEHYYEINNKKYYGVGSSGCNKNNETYYHILKIDSDGKPEYIKRIIKYDRDSFENVMRNIDYPDKEVVSKIFFGL